MSTWPLWNRAKRKPCGDCGHPRSDHTYMSWGGCLNGTGISCMCHEFQEETTPEILAAKAQREAAMRAYLCEQPHPFHGEEGDRAATQPAAEPPWPCIDDGRPCNDEACRPAAEPTAEGGDSDEPR